MSRLSTFDYDDYAIIIPTIITPTIMIIIPTIPMIIMIIDKYFSQHKIKFS